MILTKRLGEMNNGDIDIMIGFCLAYLGFPSFAYCLVDVCADTTADSEAY